MGHGDSIRKLAAKFSAGNRYTNFGPILLSMEVQGFRGIDDLQLDFRSPITALCGLNGTGKSTLAQLATCAYRKPSTGSERRYYVKDFFPVSAADPSPFTVAARTIYTYAVQTGDPQQVTVTRANKEWSGYKRQPERAGYYIGFTQFIPKVERRDFSIYGGPLTQLGVTRNLEPGEAQQVSAIVGLPYESLGFAEVTHRTRSAELAMATRRGRTYSENHMGFGEGRVVYMVNAMEKAPAQSLFVLEEPETSLHGEAQERLGRYFVDVSTRRGHQVIITTHSAALLAQFGADSVAYLRRRASDDQLEVTPGLATYQIDAYLRGDRAPGNQVVCTEDSFARQLTAAIFRHCDRDLIAGCRFVEAGGADQVRQAVRILRDAGMKAVGLTDGDMSDSGRDCVLALPGGDAPERVVFADPVVQSRFASEYGIDVDECLVAVTDHHDYASTIGVKLGLDEIALSAFACDTYVKARQVSEFADLIRFVKDGLG